MGLAASSPYGSASPTNGWNATWATAA